MINISLKDAVMEVLEFTTHTLENFITYLIPKWSNQCHVCASDGDQPQVKQLPKMSLSLLMPMDLFSIGTQHQESYCTQYTTN